MNCALANAESNPSVLLNNWLSINPFSAKEVLIDFTLSNTRRFYSSKGDPLALKGLKNYLP